MFILEARSAREGGALNFTVELFPRVERVLRDAGRDVVSFVGPPTSAADRLVRRRAYLTSRGVLHAGNRATFAPRARKIVCVRDRLLLERDLPRVNNTPRYLVRRNLLAAALAVADVVVVPTRSMVDPLERFRHRYRLKRLKCEVILHGRPDWVPPPPRAVGRPMSLLFTGYPLWHKNFPLLARVVAAGRERGLPLRLTVTASGDAEVDGRRLDNWFDSGTDVDFIGAVARDGLPELYAEHDVLMFPSLFEAFGLPLIEAMVMDMPIVVSDREWAHEVCGDAALYADPRNENEWVEALRSIASHGRRSNAEGLERARAFDWDDAAERYATLLDPGLRLA